MPRLGIARGATKLASQSSVSCNPFCCNHLQFLTQFGTHIAFQNGVNSEMNSSTDASSLPHTIDQLTLDGESVRTMRRRLHELANVFTGVMIACGLLSEYLEGGSLQSYVGDICQGSERGSALVRELHSQLLEACGEVALRQAVRPKVQRGAVETQ